MTGGRGPLAFSAAPDKFKVLSLKAVPALDPQRHTERLQFSPLCSGFASSYSVGCFPDVFL